MTGIYSSVRSSLLLNYESQESENEESEDWGRLVTNQRTAQTVWADAEAGTECVIRLANEVVDAQAYHLLDGQALALAQRFQPPNFFI